MHLDQNICADQYQEKNKTEKDLKVLIVFSTKLTIVMSECQLLFLMKIFNSQEFGLLAWTNDTWFFSDYWKWEVSIYGRRRQVKSKYLLTQLGTWTWRNPSKFHCTSRFLICAQLFSLQTLSALINFLFFWNVSISYAHLFAVNKII